MTCTKVTRKDSGAVTAPAGALPLARGVAEMRIVHVITRLIIGGAQENTLLTVDDLHHQYHDDVTLITGPAEGPEGDLFDRATERGLKVEVMPELVRADPSGSGSEGLPSSARGLSETEAGGRAYAQLESRHPGPSRSLARTRAGDCAHDPRTAVWAIRDAAGEPSLRRAGAVGGPPGSCHRQRVRCHDQAGARGRSGAARTVSHCLQRHGRRCFSRAPAPRQDVRRELGLGDDEIAFATVARLFELKGHDDIVAIARDVLASNPKIKFVWIGDGIFRERLIADLERLGIPGSFILTGLVPPDRIPELLCAVDAVIHPSLREGLARRAAPGAAGGTSRDQL